MLIEQCAYANRLRLVTPAAKGIFCLCGVIASFAAGTPEAACGVAAALACVTVLVAGIPLGRYLRVAAPALLFLGVSACTLAVSLKMNGPYDGFSIGIEQASLQSAAQAAGRSLGALSALLFFAMTTPLADSIGLLRRLKAPETLLDIMTLCYRTLFVFSDAVRETTTAQAARLGYATSRQALRSLGILTANLTVQVWQRSQALHAAALARNGDGPLRFLEHDFRHSGRYCFIFLTGGVLIIVLSQVLS
jgi:cobalt/nickel transport system permease protein